MHHHHHHVAAAYLLCLVCCFIQLIDVHCAFVPVVGQRYPIVFLVALPHRMYNHRVVTCFAAAIFDHRDMPIAGSSVSKPNFRLGNQPQKQYVRPLLKTCDRISQGLGGDRRAG
jgi:hypothetical protein